MATAGLSGRLARFEERVEDLAFARMADGADVAELRALFAVLRARHGPHWTDRDMAALIAERWGGDVAEVYARLKADRAAMRKGRLG